MKTAIINIATTEGEIFKKEIEMTKMPKYSAFENIQTSLDEFFTDWKNLDKPMNIKKITNLLSMKFRLINFPYLKKDFPKCLHIC